MKEAQERGLPPPKHFEDVNVADVMMDFLFASQDASTASLTWLSSLLADHPEVLAKARPRLPSSRASYSPSSYLHHPCVSPALRPHNSGPLTCSAARSAPFSYPRCARSSCV